MLWKGNMHLTHDVSALKWFLPFSVCDDSYRPYILL